MNRKNEPVAVLGLDKPRTVYFDFAAAERIKREMKFNALAANIRFVEAVGDPEEFLTLAIICMSHDSDAPTREVLSKSITSVQQYEEVSMALFRARARFSGQSDEEFDERITKMKSDADKLTKTEASAEAPLATTA